MAHKMRVDTILMLSSDYYASLKHRIGLQCLVPYADLREHVLPVQLWDNCSPRYSSRTTQIQDFNEGPRYQCPAATTLCFRQSDIAPRLFRGH